MVTTSFTHHLVCVSGCHDNVSPDEWRGIVGAFHGVAFRKITQRAFHFEGRLIACQYRGSSSGRSHRERLMYSIVVQGFNIHAAVQDNVLCLGAYWGSTSMPVHVCFWPHKHND